MNILVHGMHGMGDCIRQRAILQQLLPGNNVWLESSWVSIYRDLIEFKGLRVIHKATNLRTQTKNAGREAGLFDPTMPPPDAKQIRVWYPPKVVRETGSVMAAMCQSTGTDFATADFTLPIHRVWAEKASALLHKLRPQKPIMIYRPLVDRPSDWTGCNARNPDHDAYYRLFNSIRERYYVISVADLQPGVEWIVGHPVKADAEFHNGELSFEVLAALTSVSQLVFCSPGFAGVLAQAVGTRVCCVFGGYERSKFFFAGRQLATCLGIDPINPCECFSHSHDCQKAINLPVALNQLWSLTQ